MELTPIMTRGKRRRLGLNKLFSAPLPKRRQSKSKHESKRESDPLKLTQSIKSKASLLENMIPLEIMEKIFWLSGPNANFPLASPLIGGLLSGRSTLQITFINAFEPTWDMEWDDIYWRAFPLRGLTGDPKLQSALLEQPWANISFILECWNIYVRRRAQQHEAIRAKGLKKRIKRKGLKLKKKYTLPLSFAYKKIWGEYPDGKPVDQLDRFKTRKFNCLANPEMIKQSFFDDYAAFRRIDDSKSKVYYFPPLFQSTYCHVHRETRIPDSLFTSLFDEESFQKLFWLVRGGALLTEDQTWEFTLEAFRRAVPEDWPRNGELNLPMVRLLRIIDGFQKWPTDCRKAEVSRLQKLIDDAPKTNGFEPLINKLGFISSQIATPRLFDLVTDPDVPWSPCRVPEALMPEKVVNDRGGYYAKRLKYVRGGH